MDERLLGAGLEGCLGGGVVGVRWSAAEGMCEECVTVSEFEAINQESDFLLVLVSRCSELSSLCPACPHLDPRCNNTFKHSATDLILDHHLLGIPFKFSIKCEPLF